MMAGSESIDQPPPAEADGESKQRSSNGEKKRRIYLVPYPKFIFMYPTLIISLIGSLVLGLGGHWAPDPATDTTPVVVTVIFLVVMMANLFVIVFDFPRATSLTLVFVVTTMGLGIWLLFLTRPDFLPAVRGAIGAIRPVANSTFYHCTSFAMGLMYIAVFISARFNYWELSHNELLHHHGVLSDLKRYPAPNLRVDKEINDVFEYALLGAGRLILHPSTEKRAIVLDNILFVSHKEAEMTKLLGSIKVRIGNDSGN